MYNDEKDSLRSSDYEWFRMNHKILYEKYGECFLVIKNKTIIGVYKNIHEGIRETEKNEEKGTFIIQPCVENIEDTYFDIVTPFF